MTTAKLTKEEQAAKIEAAIVAARAVAATPEARALARRTGGKFGVWTAEDEARLRRGEIAIPNGGGLYRLRDGEA